MAAFIESQNIYGMEFYIPSPFFLTESERFVLRRLGKGYGGRMMMMNILTCWRIPDNKGLY